MEGVTPVRIDTVKSGYLDSREAGYVKYLMECRMVYLEQQIGECKMADSKKDSKIFKSRRRENYDKQSEISRKTQENWPYK